MQETPATQTRNFALIGHAGEGKTTLCEALLFAAGATQQQGAVADGTSQLDTAPEEKERRHTLAASAFTFAHDGMRITLVDTPGDPNFSGDARIALHAVDAALLLVNAVDGVKVGGESLWRAAETAGTPVLAFINQLEHERADFAAAVDALKQLGAKPAPIVMPFTADGNEGCGAQLQGVVDLLHMQAWQGGKPADIPAQCADAAAAARTELVEAAAECDDALLEKYLDAGELNDAEVLQGLCAGINARALVPVLGGAALKGIGAGAALELLTKLLPSPATRAPFTTAEGNVIAADATAPFSARIFKTAIDRYAGKLSMLRVVSGTVAENSTVRLAADGTQERFGKLLLLQGGKHTETPQAGPGDIIAVAKLKHAHTGASLCGEKDAPAPPPIPVPHGVLSYAVSAKNKGDEDKLFASLGKLVEEDPVLQLTRDASTGEFLLTGMGELHIRITAAKLKRLYEVELELHTPKVPYRETVTRKAEHIEGKLKKQSGGKGMFGVCYLTVEPLPRGAGFEFADEIVGGAIPRNLIPAVEKGCREAAAAGPLSGCPVVDVRVRCIDGKHHSVDSNEMAFKLAGSFGFKEAVAQAKPTLLEPVMNVEITVPDEHLGDVMGDLSGRRGRVQGTEARGAQQIITAQAPMAEILEYQNALTSLTGGKGAFHMEFSHYEEAPAQVREKIKAAQGGE